MKVGNVNMLSKKQALDQLILEIFRLHGALIAAGDALVSDLGLTSARWQVLGAISKAPEPLSLSQIARAMGLSRQAVRRLVNEMEAEALLQTFPHASNRRLRMVRLTGPGGELHRVVDARQEPWGQSLADGLRRDHIVVATALLRQLRAELEN